MLVFIVPGDGGSQILAKLNKTESVSYLCEKQTEWFYLWLDPTQMLPYLINCWTDNIKLIYDKDTHTTSNTPGVQMKFPDFGNTTSVEYIDVGRSSYALYFGKVVDSLLRHGYQRKESIFGAPYDFRKAPSKHNTKLSNVIWFIFDLPEGALCLCPSLARALIRFMLERIKGKVS